jgi:hypothetical protein
VSYPGGWRPHIESALCLSVDRLLKTGCITPGNFRSGTLRWTRTDHWGGSAEEIASAGYSAQLGDDSGTLTLHYTCTGRAGERKAITCTIALVTRPCHYGGRRWYFVCPYTGRRALKLYKWSGIDLYCHRNAIKPRPTYASQRESGGNRIIAQRWALRRKLGDNFSDLFGEPCKPKRMHWRTFNRYAARDAELADREWGHFARVLGRLGAFAFDEAAALAEKWGD